MAIEIEQASISYCPFYCEENVWHLAQRAEFIGHDPHVVFISNMRRRVHFEAQRVCGGKQSMCWDYHVILIALDGKGWLVFDPDSMLPWGCSLQHYLRASFPFGNAIREAPLFRVLKAAEYIQGLSTDRRHMCTEDGTYWEPPPAWPKIKADSTADFNLWEYVEMTPEGAGVVVDLIQFLRWLLPDE